MQDWSYIPKELRELPQWVVRRGKIPYTPQTGAPAKAGTPETWSTFEQAKNVYEKGGYDGIGFEFATGGGLVGIDLDHVIDKKTGEIKLWAQEFVKQMNSYTEYSPSGTGLHIFVRGSIPQDGRKKTINKETGEAVEMYQAKRYFTITGKPFKSAQIHDRSEELSRMYKRIFAEERQEQRQNTAYSTTPDYMQIGLEKDKLLAELWNGRRQSTDESANDLALMNKLAYWCNMNEMQMIEAFKQSPYALQKDDKHQKKIQRDDYLHRTAQAAIVGCKSTAIDNKQNFSQNQGAGEDRIIARFATLDCFTEEEAKWLVPGWIPEGQITLMAADGGAGKTTLWCNLIAAISSGNKCFLDPEGYTREPQKVAFLTTEDSVRKKLKRKLILAGANEHNVVTPDFLSDKEGILRGLKFGSHEMEIFIRHFKPVLCVFDPVQGFVPPDINMGSRNAMRDCMAPLISLGEECNTTFLVICHTNKRKGAYGRDRIADSADLWDVSRSVLMAGYTDNKGIRYLSNEKNNYTTLQNTRLFTINDEGLILPNGTTWKRDREYMQDANFAKSPSKREECKEFILQTLDEYGGSIKTSDLDEKAEEAGYAGTLRRAKDELKKSGEIKYASVGNSKEKIWYTQRLKGHSTPQ